MSELEVLVEEIYGQLAHLPACGGYTVSLSITEAQLALAALRAMPEIERLQSELVKLTGQYDGLRTIYDLTCSMLDDERAKNQGGAVILFR